MQLPIELQAAIDTLFDKVSPVHLRQARAALTSTYREGGVSPFRDEATRLVYLGARMPATYAATRKALQNVSLKGHLLDLGAGPGTASWAALDLFPEIEKITLIEKSRDAIQLGKKLSASHPKLKESVWLEQTLDAPIPKADAAILSYVLGELREPQQIIEKCWSAVDTLIIVEPGTPKAFQKLLKVRDQLIDQKAHIIAPCPHAKACPNDWCHFSARVERTRLARLLKEGTLGFEDEKFCYLIVSKTPEPRGPKVCGRVIRQPLKLSGHVRLSLCSEEGVLKEKTVSRKDGEFYREARDLNWGDCYNNTRVEG